MIKLDYNRSPYDWCVYMSKLEDESFIYRVFYVDDMLIATKNMCDMHSEAGRVVGL